MIFKNKQVVVTGGTGALGTAVVGRLLDQGATVHIPAFNEDEVARFAHNEHERVVMVSGVDLTDEALVQRFYDAVGEVWASIHIAGGFDMAPLADTSADAFDKQMAMNAKTCFLCSREAVKAMRGLDVGGRIVNVAARPGVEPRQGAGMIAYTASKAAVAAITEAMGEELAARRHLGERGRALDLGHRGQSRRHAGRRPCRLADKVDDVAATIVHLASPDSGAARGAVVPVYGRV